MHKVIRFSNQRKHAAAGLQKLLLESLNFIVVRPSAALGPRVADYAARHSSCNRIIYCLVWGFLLYLR